LSGTPWAAPPNSLPPHPKLNTTVILVDKYGSNMTQYCEDAATTDTAVTIVTAKTTTEESTNYDDLRANITQLFVTLPKRLRMEIGHQLYNDALASNMPQDAMLKFCRFMGEICTNKRFV
jgi:hypothetical protein